MYIYLSLSRSRAGARIGGATEGKSRPSLLLSAWPPPLNPFFRPFGAIRALPRLCAIYVVIACARLLCMSANHNRDHRPRSEGCRARWRTSARESCTRGSVWTPSRRSPRCVVWCSGQQHSSTYIHSWVVWCGPLKYLHTSVRFDFRAIYSVP